MRLYLLGNPPKKVKVSSSLFRTIIPLHSFPLVSQHLNQIDTLTNKVNVFFFTFMLFENFSCL